MSSSAESIDSRDQVQYIAIFGTRTRFVVMVLVLLSLTSVWSNILAFNFAMICIADSNETSGGEEISFTKSQESWFTSVVALAAFGANIPITPFVNRFGIRTIFTGLGVLSAIATLLMPLAIRGGFAFVIIARALQGLAFSGNFPVIGVFCARWTYFKQTGLFVSFLVAYVQLAPALTMPISGALCTAFSWSSVFYSHGAVCLILFIVYALFYRNSPQKHPFVGSVESGKIERGKAAHKKGSVAIPFGAILRTPAIWGVWIGAVGNFFAVNLLFLFSPVYFSAVLGMSTESTGITSALAPFAQFCMKIICGGISDRLKCCGEAAKFRLFNSLAFVGSAACFIILSFMSAETQTLNYVLVGGAGGFLGCATGGFFKAAPFLSKQYSHFVTGNISQVLTSTMFVVPFIVNALTPKNTQDEWRWVFLITAAVQIVANLTFCLLVRGVPCKWTSPTWKPQDQIADQPAANGTKRF